MPIMPTGEFMNIDEVRGDLRFSENYAAAIRRVSRGMKITQRGADLLKDLDERAEQLRSVIAEYEARISA